MRVIFHICHVCLTLLLETLKATIPTNIPMKFPTSLFHTARFLMVCTPHSIMVGWFGKFILPTFSITTQSLTINFRIPIIQLCGNHSGAICGPRASTTILQPFSAQIMENTSFRIGEDSFPRTDTRT